MDRRAYGVDCDLDTTVRAVLEAHGHRQAGGELAVDLALRRARADRAPDHEVRDELRGDRIEEFAARGETELDQVEQESARETEAFVDGEGAVEVRVVDEPLPAHRGAWLLEVDAHHDPEVVAELVGQLFQPARVVEPGHRVVDGAGTDDDEQAVVLPAQGAGDLLASAADPPRAPFAERELPAHDRPAAGGAGALLAQG